MKAVVALGSNLPGAGAPPEEDGRLWTLREAVKALNALCGTRVLRTSRIYETKPVGYRDQPDFLNAAAELETALSPRALLGACLGIEAVYGRVRTFRNAPRPLDIDLLGYEDTVMAERELILPHPRLTERAFVCVPLADLYPDGRGPGLSFPPDMPADGVRLYGNRAVRDS